MMPKISVSPLATRNSSSPYWTAFRHWIRKVTRSIGDGYREGVGVPAQAGTQLRALR